MTIPSIWRTAAFTTVGSIRTLINGTQEKTKSPVLDIEIGEFSQPYACLMMHFLVYLCTTNAGESSTSCLSCSYTYRNTYLCHYLKQGSYGSRCLWSPCCTTQRHFCREGRKTMHVGNTAYSALAQEAGMEEAVDCGFPCLPFSVVLGFLGQHRAQIRWFCIPLE